MKVIKRSGVKVDYDPSRINDYLDFVCNGLENVSASAIVMASQIHFHDGIKTSDINLALRQGAESLISVDAPDYSIAAGRILMTDIRKNVYGEFEPPQLYDIIVQNTSLGLYDPYVLETYTKEEIDALNDALHHDRDFSFCYAGALEWANKYLVQDRGTKSHYETPQVAYMLMSMFYYIDEKDSVRRLDRVIRFYNYLSLGYINTPTPHNGGLRTPVRSFSSCAVAKCGDSINSINETSRVARVLATRRAGLGIDTSSLRGNKSPIRGGTVINTSPVYHAQAIEKAALSCSQGGARKGSLTFNWWGLHIDIDDFVSLKNTARSESSAMHHSDHVIWLNGRILKEAQSNGEIYLFDPPQVPKLMELFYSDKTDEFNEEYDRCIKDDTLRKKCVRAQEYITHLLSERASTHRIYIGFADNANKQSMYDVSVFPIYNTNLCILQCTIG